MKYFILSVVAVIALLVWRIDNVTSSRDTLQASLDESTAKVAGLALTLRVEREKVAELAELDRLHTEKLTNAQSENDQLAADVAAGERRLRVKAVCSRATRTSDTTAATSLDDAGTAELDPIARQDYFALRRQVTLTESALAGLQEYVSEVCLR